MTSVAFFSVSWLALSLQSIYLFFTFSFFNHFFSDSAQLLLFFLCQCVRLKKRAGDEWGLVEKEGTTSPFHSRIPLAADPACRPLAFTFVLTDREPGTGYFYRDLFYQRQNLKIRISNNYLIFVVCIQNHATVEEHFVCNKKKATWVATVLIVTMKNGSNQFVYRIIQALLLQSE